MKSNTGPLNINCLSPPLMFTNKGLPILQMHVVQIN